MTYSKDDCQWAFELRVQSRYSIVKEMPITKDMYPLLYDEISRGRKALPLTFLKRSHQALTLIFDVCLVK